MSAALIFPLIEVVGSTVSAFATELGLSSTSSAVIGTGVQTGVAAKVGSFIDKQAVNLIGQDKIDDFNKGVEKVKTYGSDFDAIMSAAYGSNSQTIDYFKNKKKPNIFDNVEYVLKETNVVKKSNIFDNSDYSRSDSTVKQTNTSLVGSLPIDQMTQTPSIGPSESYFDGHNTNFDTNFDTNLAIQITNPQTIASYIVEYANSVSTGEKNPELDVISRNPNLIVVSKELSAFYANKIPDTEEYKRIASTYNGRNLTLANCTALINQNGVVFNLVDEIGAIVQLLPTKGFTLPTLYGNFVGPYSHNSASPVSLLDLYCAFHDHDYTIYGFFDTIGDMKLVSRVSQNYDRFIPEEKGPAKIALLWFSTLGLSAGKLIGSLPKNIHRMPSTQMPQDDIYYMLDPQKAIKMPINQYAAERTQWYQELEHEFEVATITSSVFAQVGSASNKLLSKEFGNIMVELL